MKGSAGHTHGAEGTRGRRTPWASRHSQSFASLRRRKGDPTLSGGGSVVPSVGTMSRQVFCLMPPTNFGRANAADLSELQDCGAAPCRTAGGVHPQRSPRLAGQPFHSPGAVAFTGSHLPVIGECRDRLRGLANQSRKQALHDRVEPLESVAHAASPRIGCLHGLAARRSRVGCQRPLARPSLFVPANLGAVSERAVQKRFDIGASHEFR